MSHRIEERVTEYASGDVTREVVHDKGVGRHDHHPHSNQHVEVKHDGKRVADRDVDPRLGHTYPATGLAGTTPVPVAVADHKGHAHPVVQSYQEGRTPHGREYHERLDVVGDKHDKMKIKKDNEANIQVMDRAHVNTHGHTTHVHDPHSHGSAIVDHHGKHHVVGPTGGIVDHHGRETSNIVDMAKQVGRGELPANAQVRAELQPLQQHLLAREVNAGDPQTEEAMRNARKLVEAVETTIETKNSGDKFQRLIDAAARVAARTGPTAAGVALTKETRSFVKLLKELVIELGRSKSFRKALLDLFTLMKDIIGSGVDVEGGHVAHQSFVEGRGRDVGKHIKSQTTDTIVNMPEHHKQDISLHLKTVLLELRDQREAAQAIKKTIKLATLLNKEMTAHVSRAHVDPDVREVQELSLAIVQSFAVGVDIRAYLKHLRRALEFIQSEVVIREYLWECGDYLNRTIAHPERIDEQIYIQEAEALVSKGRKLAILAKEHPIFMQVMDEASALVYAIKSDEQLNDIKYRAAKVAESMTYTDRTGKSHVNFDVVATMRSELVPFLIDRIREVQVPGFRMENQGKFAYLEVHDLYVTLGDILPDRIRIKSTNDTDLTLDSLSAPVNSDSYIKFWMEGLRPEFRDFYFAFKRVGKVIKLKDEGRADLRIKGHGVNVFMKFALEMDSEHRAMLGKHTVDITMGPIDIDITQAEHKKMLNMATSLFAPQIKTAVETALKNKLEALGGEWATLLNKRVLSTIPSVSTLGSKVKQGLQATTQTVGGHKEKHRKHSKGHHDSHSHSVSHTDSSSAHTHVHT